MSITSSKQTASDVSESSDALLSGYLYKQTRDGRWQKRWFETSGVYLTYYKSKKMEKLLAALSLPEVGSIHVISIDDEEQNPEKLDSLFALELSARIYILRAANDAMASRWIQTLLKLKEQGIGISSLNPLGLVNASNAGIMSQDQPKGLLTHDDDKENIMTTKHTSTDHITAVDWIKGLRTSFVCC